jgi:hypothetical protein
MSDESKSSDEQAAAADPIDADGQAKRERSTIEFPYMDLEMAVAVAKAMFARNGGGTVANDELASQLGLSATSSGFRVRISTAKLFGFITSDRGGDGQNLTTLGHHVQDPAQERKARVDAFLNVPLFSRVYESYRGLQLPPSSALERRLVELGVAQKQAERARQVMERSADYAGFFADGREKLVRPPNSTGPKNGDDPLPPQPPTPPAPADENPGVDPIIKGLLVRLPKSGAVWPKAQRELWLKLLSGSFELIYSDGETREQEVSR